VRLYVRAKADIVSLGHIIHSRGVLPYALDVCYKRRCREFKHIDYIYIPILKPILFDNV